MKADEARALAKQHGPTLAIGVAVIAAMKLGSAPSPTPTPVAVPPNVARLAATPQEHPTVTAGVETRLVSCGGRGAGIVGDAQHSTDELGAVTLGAEPKGKCTVIFAAGTSHHCAVNGGHIAKSLNTEIVVDQISGSTFAYRCEP